jgi:hypothetical protein
VDVDRQNLQIAKNFMPLAPERMAEIEQQVASQTGDGHLEIYKTSLAYDNIITRQAHEMPIAGAHP